MAGKPRPWFRLYSEIRNDRKIKRLNSEERWVWVTILCLANDSPERGKLLFSKDMPYTIEEIADEADVPVDVVKGAIPKMEKMDMIEWEDETIVISHFLDRQYDNPSDRPTQTRERKRKSRETTDDVINKGIEAAKDVTIIEEESNEEVTSMSRESHETYTDTESETDSENKKDSSQPAAATSTVSKSPVKIFSEETAEYKLALFLRELILKNMPDARVPPASPKGMMRWCGDIDYMLRVDGRSVDNVRFLMLFCQNDQFWRSNILSPRKLREKWETLWMQMQANAGKNSKIPKMQQKSEISVGTEKKARFKNIYMN